MSVTRESDGVRGDEYKKRRLMVVRGDECNKGR